MQKKPGKTNEEISGCVSPKCVNKWPKSMEPFDDDDDDEIFTHTSMEAG
jgi:hypothetical protein